MYSNIPYCQYRLLKEVNNHYSGIVDNIYTSSRRSVILPKFVGLHIYVSNGKDYIRLYIIEQMVGRKLGEFVYTRKKPNHKVVKNETNNKKH